MSGRVFSALSWVVPAVLAVVGAYFALVYEPRPKAEQGAVSQAAERDRGYANGATEIVRELRRDKAASHARNVKRPHAESDGPRQRDLRRLERGRAGAVPVARRFFAAFAQYELGLLDSSIEDELRATTTASFASTLLAQPPRIAEDRGRPAAAQLAGLEFVAGATSGAEARTAEVVGWVVRQGTRSPIALELQRRARGWRVTGVGR